MKYLPLVFLSLYIVCKPLIIFGATCSIKTNDVGNIVGKGRDTNEAFTDAALQCFDRRETMYKAVKHVDRVDDDAALVMIDICANLKCDKTK